MTANPLVVPGGESLVGISPTEAEALLRASTDAVAAREASSTAYEGLGPQGSENLAGAAFPALVNEPDGGPPAPPEGDRIISYPASNAATLELPNHAHGALSAMEPIAVESSDGQYLPINLNLVKAGEGFKPITPETGAQVFIPRHLAEGISLSSGVTLTPVDEEGSALHAEGVLDGASVFYGDSENSNTGVLDVDTLVKPNTYGFSAETILRSERSPQKLFFRMDLPEGASLSKSASGSADVTDAGHVIAVVPAPRAHDAEGTTIQIAMTISGSTLVLSVPHQSGQYRMPLVIDPTVIDKALDACCENLNWASKTTNPNALALNGGSGGEYGYAMVSNSITYKYGYQAGESAYYVYPTQGESHIYKIVAKVIHERPTSQMQNTLSIASLGSGKEGNEALIPNEWETTSEICAVWPSCEANAVTSTDKENRVFWETRAIEAGNSSYTNDMTKASIYINQEKGLTAKLDTNDANIDGRANPLYANTWVNDDSYVGINAFDPGIGANKEILKVKQKPYWEHAKVSEEAPNHCAGAQCNECDEDTCPTGGKGTPAAIYVGSEMPDGEDTIEGEVTDAAGFKATVGPATLKFDNEPPDNLELVGLPPNNEIGDETYAFTVKATDGENPNPSSGVKSIIVSIDGRKLAEIPTASCPLGPCTASGEWTVNGEELGAGPNQVRVVATDNAENVAEKTFTLEVRHASPVSIGPGSVDPQSGQFTLTRPNVSMGSGLTFSSSYRSRNIVGPAGPFGSQWTSSIMGQQSITKLPNGSMVLADATGSQTIFTKKESGGFESPAGDPNLSLAEVEAEGVKEFVLKNATAATSTGFRVPSGGGGELWVPDVEKGGLPSETEKYASETVTIEGKQITRPTFELGSVPTGVICPTGKELTKELKDGCRALTFKYATETKASGESENQWNEYNGRLKEVDFIAYNNGTEKMQEVAVAKYLYDNHGRLRAEWDPRISPALKTIYGYDSENHVTALTLPGQETWAFVYGTIASDSSPGRLLKITQAPASAPLWAGAITQSTEAPNLSGSPVVGVRMAVSNGVWTGSPVAYGYQWEDCNTLGGECVRIAGATNANYTPSSGDVGHHLVAQVSATNGGGSVIATTTVSTTVVSAAEPANYTQTIDSGHSLNAVSCVPATTDCVVTDSAGNALYATNVSASAGATWNTWTGPGVSPSQAVDCPTSSLCLMTDGTEAVSGGNMYYATSFGGAWTEAFKPVFGITAISCASSSFCVDGQSSGYYRYSSEPASKSWTVGEAPSSSKINGVSCLSASFCAIVDGGGGVHVATTTSQVESSSWTETDVDGSTALNGVACRSTTSCLVVDNAGDVLNLTISGSGGATTTKHDIDGTNSLTAITCTSNSTCVAVDNQGNIFISTNAGETWNKELALGGKLTSVSCASWTLCVAADTSGAVMAFKTMGSVSEGEARPPQMGATVEYEVPITGAGAPYQLGKKEVEEGWGQKDSSTEATAIFARAKPHGWPAANYEGATIYYRDSRGHAVNTANPSGGIATSEYNEYGDITRSLSPDNRLVALKEGTKSVEIAKKLDTESVYGEKGTRLLETIGPRHQIKLANGKETLARNHEVYYYDEGAPTEGAPYSLVTKTTQGAEIEGESEQDVRTNTMSYSGQSNLGWKLREPTTVTIDPSGLKLKHTTVYDEITGNVLETWTPKSTGAGAPHDIKTVYYSAEPNSSYPVCGKQPQWANLPCETMPGAQPETPGLPRLPETTVTYNFWGEPLVTTSSYGSEMRKGVTAYDEAGRPLTSELASSSGTALPTVTFKYNTSTGALVEQSDTVEGKTQTVSTEFNTLSEMTKYTDANENTTTYEYSEEKGGRLVKENDGEGTRTYEYNETTGAIDGLTDTEGVNVLNFTASYDVEGNMTSETYPNGMSANFTYNPVGETISVSYVKNTHCSENCTWFADSDVPSIHGQRATQQTTLASTNNTYDSDGRLVQVQEVPMGETCTTRVYTYDEETNITNLATHPPGSGGVCTNEGGHTESHSYDSANRLTDTGTAYDPFGDITKLGAADAGGTELQSTFYDDGQLATQSQGEQNITYKLDPEHRTNLTVDTGKITSTYISHYAAPGASLAWIVEPTSGHWTRYVTGIAGFSAIETEAGAPVLQLTDLQGNVVARASSSETATKLLSTERSTEYGVPTTTKPERYGWLGSNLLPTELPSGVVAMGVRSYVPQLGRFLQPDPIPGGSANAYAYTDGDPLDSADPSGEYTAVANEFDENYVHERAKDSAEARAAEIRAAEEAARAEAEQKAREAYIKMMGGPSPAEGAAEPLGGYEGWACEYAEETGQEGEGCPSGGGAGGDPIAVAAAPCAHEENPKANHCNSKGYGEILVHFDGETLTPAQILARALAEYKYRNKNVLSIEKGLSELMKGLKETQVPIEQAVNGAKVIVWEIMEAVGPDL